MLWQKAVSMAFGNLLRELRQKQKVGIKQVARDLGVNYTYLSKLENEKAKPSQHFVEKIADYFGCDKDLLCIAADKIPEDAMEAIRRQPAEALKFLRQLLQDDNNKRNG
jgi:transcriptional regulator with XRE-family HTH domain